MSMPSRTTPMLPCPDSTPRKAGLARRAAHIAFALGLSTALGCTSHTQVQVDRNPTADFGTGATIIMPGQSVPMPDPERPFENSNITSIGGARSNGGAQREMKSQPGFLNKLLSIPAGIVAAPVAAVAGALSGDEEKEAEQQSSSRSTSTPGASTGAATPNQSGAPSQNATIVPGQPAPQSRDPHQNLESARLNGMERELASRGAHPRGAAPPIPLPIPLPAPGAFQQDAPGQAPRTLSIADELAILQASVQPKARPEDIARSTTSDAGPKPESGGVADQVGDRDGDGRPDHWVYRHLGKKVRELFDENGDTAPDRTVYYDAQGEQRSVEEDRNLDGRLDSWVEFRDGNMARQRRDTNHDGFLDTWTFYRSGTIAREEQDLNGDGFRNRMAFYEEGRLTREREDRNGDGRIDRVTLYDAEERVLQRDEDQDGNGLIDTRSYYESGRLSRRELIEEQANDSVEPETLTEPEWSTGSSEAG